MKVLKISLILFILVFLFLCVLYGVFIADDKDFCLDSGFCREGLSLNIENKKITVNKESCIKYNGTWLDKKKACRFKN